MVIAITAKEAYSLLKNPQVYLVDTRLLNDFKIISADLRKINRTAVNLAKGLSKEDFSDTLEKISAGSASPSFIFMCYKGISSLSIAENASQLGYEKVYNITGGFSGSTGWKDSGLPIIDNLINS